MKEEKPDSQLALFLSLLAREIDTFPDSLRELDEDRMAEIERLTAGVKVDPWLDLGSAEQLEL